MYRLNAGATEAEVHECEERLSVLVTTAIVPFWTVINGLLVDNPRLEVLPLSKFSLEGKSLVFAICSNDMSIAFDTAGVNVANQWSIINARTGYRVTYTVASFWSAHMWTWIVKRRPIWFDVHGDRPDVQ